MSAINFDPAIELNLFFRIARTSSRTLIFSDENGNGYDISSIDWSLKIKRRDNTDLMSLTIGSGLTVESNELIISVSDSDTDKPPGLYYWELVNNTTKQTWFYGNAYFINKQNPNSDNDLDVTVNLTGTLVKVTISNTSNNIDGGTL